MASVHSAVPPQHSFLPSISRGKSKAKASHAKSIPKTQQNFPVSRFSRNSIFSGNKRASVVANSAVDELDVIPVQSNDITDQQESVVVNRVEMDSGDGELTTQVSGFGANDGLLSLEGFSSSSSSGLVGNESEENMEKLVDRTINAAIVLAAGTFALTKLLTIDSDYWHGWTIYEILRYAPQHNWSAYEEALKTNPVFAKMVISGVVYSVGDWIAQCFEGKPLFEFDRARMFRSGLVGFTLHGSLSHYYYQFCEELFPYKGWWVVPAKVAFDQTAWSAVWNSIYYTVVGFLRLDSPINIFNELKATFFPMLTAGWKLWPFAHLITYGVIPVEQRLLWVDMVELIWVTILSTYSNEKSEARNSSASTEVKSTTSVYPPEDHMLPTNDGNFSIRSAYEIFAPRDGENSDEHFAGIPSSAVRCPKTTKWPENGDDPCGPPSWPYVFCFGGRVTQIQTQIQAKNLGLKGSLPPNFNQLSELQNLGLQRNNLSGMLPTFSGLSKLQFAFLDYNEFDAIPSDFFNGLTSIRVLWLNDQDGGEGGGMTGPIDVIASMTYLRRVWLHGNHFTGTIP
ncbi:Mpv17/PMP22 [Sesbania bispinosa]|nr:Mpv17/PMP22 [Sesbania bispinosa]